MVSFQETDHGLKRILAQLREAEKLEVRVGYFRDQTHSTRSGPNAKWQKNPMGFIAYQMEAGSQAQNRPPRPFMRQTNKRVKTALKKRICNLYKQILSGSIDTKEALDRLGKIHRNDIKHEIQNGAFPPLAASTIARKGHDQPLIDTRQMLDATTYRVVPKSTNDENSVSIRT